MDTDEKLSQNPHIAHQKQNVSHSQQKSWTQQMQFLTKEIWQGT